MTDMVFGTVASQPGDPILPRWWRSLDRWSLFAVVILFCVGILLGLAASVPLAERNGLTPFYYVYKQVFFGGVALTAMIVTSMMSPRTIRRLGVFGFAIGFIAILLLPVLGTDFGKGATRWYSLGFTSLQPSEFLKPCFVVFCAWLMAASFDVGGPPGKRWSFIVAIVVTFILAMQPDFGQASLVLAAWGLMYFVAGAPVILLILMALGVSGFGYLAYHNSEHFARRIDGFLNPEVDPRTQLGYATNAIQEGGFFGVGVGEGTVKWSLPDAHTDFIIAVAAEEYGLVMVLFIIALFMALTVRSLFRLMNERDVFIRLAGTGLVALFGMQALINMGVAVRLLPAKGMTLPFISYGGSSLVAGGIALGMLLAFTRSRPQGDMSDALRNG
ncbi:cell division protein FtsW [Amylibacter kogurei]|uniref:Probable peptidoglycan glycosyltransferase FtsW n=1 Tax=Paramylibacter kogurei TaxID=1889778 RepID=A0A2G5K469_9RHOB|nr:putative lipid II flippase FtsW [Amylibacter kogurei]PIB24215.1 cell division protein FtsW [Amylibacter kogurei]